MKLGFFCNKINGYKKERGRRVNVELLPLNPSEYLWERRSGAEKKQTDSRKRENSAVTGSLWASLEQQRDVIRKIWHLVPIILSICLRNIYSLRRGDHVCGMRFLRCTWSSCEHDNSTEGHTGVMVIGQGQIHLIRNNYDKGETIPEQQHWLLFKDGVGLSVGFGTGYV